MPVDSPVANAMSVVILAQKAGIIKLASPISKKPRPGKTGLMTTAVETVHSV